MTTVTPTADPYQPARNPSQDEAYSVVTVLLLIVGGFVVPIVGWFAGVVMLWAGPGWSAGSKWLGTLVWPAVVAVPALAMGLTAAATHSSGWTLGVTLTVGAVTVLAVLPWTFVHLLRAARR